MATSLTEFVCTIPAGTPLASPHTVSCDVGTLEVESIRWRVPPGSRGHLGWWLAMSGQQVLPDRLGTYVVADGEWDTWTVRGLPNTGAWQLVGFNTGTNDHQVILTFFTYTVVPDQSGTVDVTLGFPTSDAEISTMWVT